MASTSSISPTTGIDTYLLQYKQAERKAITPTQNRITSLQARLNVLGTVKTKLSALSSAAATLSQTGTSSVFSSFALSSSDSTKATGSATSSAALGSHSLLVTQLAKTDLVLSSQFTSSDTGIATAEGAGTKQLQIVVNGVTTNVDVAVDASYTNATVLSSIASAINASAAAVTASVVSDTTSTSRLVLRSDSTGSNNAISVSDVTGTLFNSVGLSAAIVSGRTASTSTTAGYAVSATSSLDANFTLDGISMVRNSNSVSDALTGVSFQLLAAQDPLATPLTLTVGVDKDKVRSAVQQFITTYNDALQYITSRTAIDPNTRVRQILASDSTFMSLKQNLRTNVLSAVTSVSSGNPSVLKQIGISINEDGTMTLSDQATFDAAVADGGTKVSDLFNSSDGVATRVQSLLSGLVSSGGQLDVNSTSTRTQIDSLNKRVQRFEDNLTHKADLMRLQLAQLQSVYQQVVAQQQSYQSIVTAIGG